MLVGFQGHDLLSTLSSLSSRRLELLSLARTRAGEHARANDDRGRRLAQRVSASGATPAECDKYRACVEEADKIASLLAGLAARMARAQNAVDAVGSNANTNAISTEEKVREEGGKETPTAILQVSIEC